MKIVSSLGHGLSAASLALLVNAVPARADLPVSVQIGPQFPTQSNARNAGGNTQIDVGLNYDIVRPPVIPAALSFQFDEANGANGAGNLNEYGFGFAGRLTTPLYAGAGFSIYNTTGRPNSPFAPSFSSTALGTNYFVGDRFLSLPGGVNFSLQAGLKLIPQFDGVNPSAFGVGLRVQL